MFKERVTSIIAIILLATLVGVSYWYSVKAELEGMGHLSDIEAPEFITHNTTVTKFDDKGVAKAKVFAKYAEYYSDGHAKATYPEYWSLTPGEGQISATADRGEMSKGGEILRFYGNVDLRQAAYGKNPASRIQTDQLDAFPDTDTYKTDHYVTLTRGDDVSTGIGADFDNVEHTFKLRSKVATTLQPRDKNDSEKKPATPTPVQQSGPAPAAQPSQPAPKQEPEAKAENPQPAQPATKKEPEANVVAQKQDQLDLKKEPVAEAQAQQQSQTTPKKEADTKVQTSQTSQKSQAASKKESGTKTQNSQQTKTVSKKSSEAKKQTSQRSQAAAKKGSDTKK